MRIFKPKDFARSARKASLNDDDLRAAVRRAKGGVIDADLGHGLIKQRIPRQNQGRSGGFRSILFFRRGHMAVFLHLFAKSDRDNVTIGELAVLQSLAKGLSGLEAARVDHLIENGLWDEITHDEDD